MVHKLCVTCGCVVALMCTYTHMLPQQQTVDYSKHALSNDASVREDIARRLLTVGAALEREFGSAQDVEGCFVGKDLYVVQTRPQPL